MNAGFLITVQVATYTEGHYSWVSVTKGVSCCMYFCPSFIEAACRSSGHQHMSPSCRALIRSRMLGNEAFILAEA